MSTEMLLSYLMLIIAGLAIWYVLINVATRSDRKIRNQETMIKLLIKLCEKNGVSPDELEVIKSVGRVK